MRTFIYFCPVRSSMSTVQLSSTQKRILSSLVNLAEGDERAVRGRDIAEAVDRNPGTIRNRMQSLRALQLVEGVPGPKGGYRPTTEAYETLDVDRLEETAPVPLEREGEPVPDATVSEIDFTSVHDPERCRAEVVVRGPIGAFGIGDEVTVGPTPSADLRVSGIVETTDIGENVLLIDVASIRTEPDD